MLELISINNVVKFRFNVLVIVEVIVSSGYKFNNCIRVGLLVYILFLNKVLIWFIIWFFDRCLV